MSDTPHPPADGRRPRKTWAFAVVSLLLSAAAFTCSWLLWAWEEHLRWASLGRVPAAPWWMHYLVQEMVRTPYLLAFSAFVMGVVALLRGAFRPSLAALVVSMGVGWYVFPYTPW
jgi:hypothetical protein